MARPPARELTERELEVMHVFWNRGNSTVGEIRDALAEAGLDRAYTTVATLVRILTDKRFSDPDERGAAVLVPAGSVVRGCLAEAAGRADRPGVPRLARAIAGALDGAEGADGQGAVHAGRRAEADRRNDGEHLRTDAAGEHRPRDGLRRARDAGLPGPAAIGCRRRGRSAASSSIVVMAPGLAHRAGPVAALVDL